MKLEEAGWLPALACCVILVFALLTFLAASSMALPKVLHWMRVRLDRVQEFAGSFFARIPRRSRTSRDAR